MAASIKIVANTDGMKTDVKLNLENLRTELNRVKADLKDELDKVNADAERLRAFNGSHRQARSARGRCSQRWHAIIARAGLTIISLIINGCAALRTRARRLRRGVQQFSRRCHRRIRPSLLALDRRNCAVPNSNHWPPRNPVETR